MIKTYIIIMLAFSSTGCHHSPPITYDSQWAINSSKEWLYRHGELKYKSIECLPINPTHSLCDTKTENKTYYLDCYWFDERPVCVGMPQEDYK